MDLPAARSQHARYAEALAKVGLAVETLPADDERPDAVFVQDRVAVIDGRAIVGPSAVAERRGETEPIAAVLRKHFPIVDLRAPATLDWGDVLVTEDALFVGLSERSNEAAVRQLRELLAPGRMVEGVAVPAELLHLLSGCAYLGGGELLAVEALAPFAAARGFHVLPVPEDEILCANVLAVGGDVVVPAGYPKTAALLERSGRRVHAVAVSEYEKRDGGVTCLSVLY
ncbi:MAG TPA: arginine deiminase family protein [Thermoanaerobaculia bacterium]|nr:arginine deiminase family protein [Thermoanaerobaculia bacterium]